MNRDDLEAGLAHLHPDAFAWARRCASGDREEAEDALHTAYERILAGRARFDGPSSFRTWLFGVVRRTALEERSSRRTSCESSERPRPRPGRGIPTPESRR